MEATVLKLANENERHKYIQRVLENPSGFGVGRCLICESASSLVGVFIPSSDAQSKFGAPDGGERVCVYGLCNSCQSKSETSLLVEAEFLKAVAP